MEQVKNLLVEGINESETRVNEDRRFRQSTILHEQIEMAHARSTRCHERDAYYEGQLISHMMEQFSYLQGEPYER